MGSVGNRFAAAVVAALVVSSAPVGARAAVAPATIRSADGGAACSLGRAELVCTNRVLQRRRPPLALLLRTNRAPRAIQRRLSWSGRTPVLRRGSSRAFGAFRCRAVGAGLLCTDRTGAGLAVSAARVSVLLPPAVSP